MLRRLVLLPMLCLLLAGCPEKAPPAGDSAVPDVLANPAPVDAAPPPPEPAPVPAPAGKGGKAPAGPPGEVDRSCKVDADCAVKDVGNCCGYYPACVNKDSPTFPDQVQAACAAEGRSSICGFQDISSCSCVDGQCAAQSTGLAEPARTD